jgi:sugar/nucleoside kinase (ribokinase family)
MSEIACLGILVADLIGRPINALPPRGRLGLVDSMTLHVGGCAANTGIDLARLGVETAVLGKVGEDGLGDFIQRTFESEGIDVAGVVRDPAVNTSATMVMVDDEGERTFLHSLGGNAEYQATDVSWTIVSECKVLHVAGALVMPGMDGEPMADVLRYAHDLGLTTSLDVVWDATGKWMETLRPCLEHLDYFMPSLAEAQQITGREYSRDVAFALRDEGVGTVALKLGTEGCYIVGADGEVSAPAYPVQAVDGTGSGDAFDAGLLVGILRGWDIERSARFANAVGALCVTDVGATAGVRSMEQVEAFLSERDPSW